MRRMRVVVLAVDGTQSLDVLGPVEVLHAATRIATARGLSAGYEVSVVSPGGGGVALSKGLRPAAEPLPGPRAAIDTVIAAGGEGARRVGADDPAVVWVRAAAARARRVCSVCTGSLVPAPRALRRRR